MMPLTAETYWALWEVMMNTMPDREYRRICGDDRISNWFNRCDVKGLYTKVYK